MIYKETGKVGTDHDKMEKFIKYNICMSNIKKVSFWKILSQVM